MRYIFYLNLEKYANVFFLSSPKVNVPIWADVRIRAAYFACKSILNLINRQKFLISHSFNIFSSILLFEINKNNLE